MANALLFPGQGSQEVGMGKEMMDAFPIAKETLQEVCDAIDFDLIKLMHHGPEEELTRTINAQPAIMACSMAVMRVMEKEVGFDVAKGAACAAGHSLGEYSALTAAGALSLADTAKLLRIRGFSMQQAVPEGQGAMAAILGLTYDQVMEIVKAAAIGGDVCEVANDNCEGQVVISGSVEGINMALEIAQSRRARKSVLLPVSAPFHCSLMKPAAETMEKALKSVKFSAPAVPIVSNVTAKSETKPDEFPKLLVEQITGTVRWRECMEYVTSRSIKTTIEIGHGNVLSGLMKRIDKDAEILRVNKPEDLDEFAKAV